MPPPTAPRHLHVLGTASIWVLGQVAGPRRTARVLHAGDDAVYLDLDGVCLAVLSAHAVRVPCGIRTTLPALPPVEAGATAVVHDGSVDLPGVEVMVSELVDTTVPVLGPDEVVWAGDRLPTLVEQACPGHDRIRQTLPPGALDALAAGDPAVVGSLLGLGPGLTPLGDDVLAGWLAAAVSFRHPALPEMRRAVGAAAPGSTTVLSSSLLACAARGEVVPAFRDMVAGIAVHDAPSVHRGLASLARIGDTSGEGLALGATLALAGHRASSPLPGQTSGDDR